MAQIAAFRGFRYDPERWAGNDLSSVIAPPYDVLSESDRDALLRRSRNNIVAVDLPHMPPGFAGPPEAYAGAASILKGWMDDGTLIRDARPALYVYHQQFENLGRRFLRRMFFARLHIEPFGTGMVFPHEQTFSGPKEDRLMLTRATRCNLSPVFGLYPDPLNHVAGLLDVSDRPPTVTAILDGVESRLWVVDDADVIGRVVKSMSDRPVFIADGHHRYGTAMMYRDEVADQMRPLPVDHSANYVLIVLCAMEDPGLIILPTHRLVQGLPPADAIQALRGEQGIQVESADATRCDPVPSGEFRFFDGAAGQLYRVRVESESAMSRMAEAHSEAWRRLDVAVLHRYLIDGVLSPLLPKGRKLEIQYLKDMAAGRQEAKAHGALLIEMSATSMQDLQDVCRAGEVMPHKSTFFYPKLATGLVINPLSE